jgi:NAD(P)-dependent dehydrogenase (short-subunit alcohol dehydrogenase family)
MARLEGKTAVITGGNSGMGRATAEAMVREGARVLIFGRNRQTLDETCAAIGPQVLAVEGDAADLDDLDRLAAEAKKAFGKVDIVFANAGTGHGTQAPPLEITEAQFDFSMGANLKGKLFTITKLVPLMPKGGSIMLTGGITNYQHIEGCTLLSIAQAGCRALARGLSVELAPRGIRVNSICPGYIYGPAAYAGVDLDAFDKSHIQRVPMKRMGTGDEIAHTAVFLGSDESSYITGAEIVVDGGATLPI